MLKSLFGKKNKGLPVLALVTFFTLSFAKTQAQTNLYAGDVAFVSCQMNNNTGDTFAIVLLKNITTGTQIGFTDGCYKDANGYNILTSNKNEWYFIWQATSNLAKGTIIKYWNSTASASNAGGVANASTGTIVSGDALSLGHNGGTDQVFAFQGISNLDTTTNYTLTVTRYLAGIHHNYIGGLTNDANWDGSSSAAGLFQSELPDSLVNGVNCLRLDSSSVKRENAVMTSNYLSLDKYVINNVANWTNSNTPQTPYIPVRAIWTGSWDITPSSTIDAIIQSDSSPGNFTCRSLRIDTTYTLKVTIGKEIKTYGDLYNYGNGVGSSNGNITFYKTGTASLYGSSAISYAGVIRIDNATTLATNDLLILDATGASTYGQIGAGNTTFNGAITGNITAKYYIGGSTYGWRTLCSPVDGATLAQIDDDIPLYFTSTNPALANVFTFSEAGSGSHWTSPGSGLSQTMDTSAFAVYMRGPQLPVTLDITGTYHGTSDYVLTGLTKTGSSTDTSGWHIVRNPWPTGFYWDGTIANIQGNACYVYDHSSGTYSMFDNIIDNVLPPFQALTFKVTSNNVTVTLPNANRNVAMVINYFDKTGNTENYVGLTLKNLQTNVTDIAKFYTDEDAQNGYDGLDGDKKMNDPEAPSIYFTNSGVKLYKDVWTSIPEAGIDLPVAVSTTSVGKYEISANLENIEPGTEVFLEDNISGKLYDLTKGSCTFTVAQGETVDRFILHIRKKSTTGIDDAEGVNYFIGSNGTNVSINGTQTETINIEITDLLGKTLTTSSVEAQAGQATILPAMSVATGYYLVKVTGNSGMQVSKVFLK